MKFKVGDRVKIIRFPNGAMIGKECEIIKINPFSPGFPYRVRQINDGSWNCLVGITEIEKVPTKGQQLLLFEL